MYPKNKSLINALKASIDGVRVLLKEKAAIKEIYLLFFSIIVIILIKPSIFFCILLILLPLIILSIDALNTSIEYVCDKITTSHSTEVKKAKDLGSAAILILLIADIILFVFCFYEYFIMLRL